MGEQLIELRAVKGKTGRLLGELLREKGVEIGTGGSAVVSYGVPLRVDVPALNSNAGRLNKFEELKKLLDKKVPVIPFTDTPYEDGWCASAGLHNNVVFGRKLKHTKGKDIKVFKGEGAYATIKDKSDYYTAYIPHVREYRVWAYRGRHLGTYEKVRKFKRGKNHPDMVWNWRNGYAFGFLREAPEALKQIGKDAVAALDLDFGAVDVIEDEGGRYYVLEVNTAPGVQGPRQGLQNLASKIAKWVEGGFKRRNGDKANV